MIATLTQREIADLLRRDLREVVAAEVHSARAHTAVRLLDDLLARLDAEGVFDEGEFDDTVFDDTVFGAAAATP